MRRWHVAWITCILLVVIAWTEFAAMGQSHNHEAMQQAQSAVTPANNSFWGNIFQMYTPRQVCMNYEADVIWLNLISDGIIAAAYYSIPIALIYFVRRRKDLSFNYLFLAFAAFILACGTTHVFSIIAIWHPVYRLDGLVKAFTALVSVGTAIASWPLLFQALRIPSPAMLRESNVRLEGEIQQRVMAEADLLRMKEQLELRVAARTAELESVNSSLRQAEAGREELLASERIARADAEKASRMKDDFVATLSHELRTPMSAIIGWTQVLKSSTATKDDFTQGLEIIERNTRVQQQLIEDLLDMSRILAGKLRLDIQPVELDRIVQAAIDTVHPAAAAKEIRIQTELDPNGGTIMADPNRLQQIIWNLLSNAVKFTPRGGSVIIRTLRNGTHVELVVVDTGCGMKPEFLPHVFERFRQADSSTTRRHGGLGLGLAIVRQLVELHGGTVRADSAGENQGATFTVELPLAATQNEQKEERPVVSSRRTMELIPPSLAGLNLLFVDDDPDTRTMVRRVLAASGARVEVAGSAREAYSRIRELRPNVIVSDIGMPDEDGFSLIKTVRSWPASEGGAIPAVALTAFASGEDRRRALLMGFQMHLAKPVEPADLVAVIASVAGITNRPSGN